jgi:hypothetical protein
MSLYNDASLLLIPSGYKSGKVYSQKPTDGDGDLTFTRASDATRVNSAGEIETVTTGVPRLDYSQGSCPALLLEPQRTNSIRNSTMVGAVAGTPGTLPTNYVTLDRGLTREVVGTGVANGIDYLDLRFSGTANSSSPVRIDLETTTGIAALTGQNWSLSTYFAIISGSFDNVQLSRFERTAAGTVVAGSAISLTITPNTSLLRYSQSALTVGGATTAFVCPHLNIGVTNGSTYDFTVRIAAPQMELGAYATTFIPTTTATVTRIADVASKTGISSLIGQTEGTLFFEGLSEPSSEVCNLNRSTTNSVFIYIRSNGTVAAFVYADSVVINLISAVPSSNRFKAAIAYKSNSIAFYVNGNLIAENTTATFTPNVTMDRFDIGFGGYVAPKQTILTNQAALFPTRLTNAQLAQLTTL